MLESHESAVGLSLEELYRDKEEVEILLRNPQLSADEKEQLLAVLPPSLSPVVLLVPLLLK